MMRVEFAGEATTADQLAAKLDDNRMWCWSESEHSETWQGPFDTREAAIADAEAELFDQVEEFSISRCNYAVPSESAAAWAETLEPLESLHDNTDDELQDYDGGETFAYVDSVGEKAIEELTNLIADWAARNIKARWFCCDGDTMETIKRTKKEQAT